VLEVIEHDGRDECHGEVCKAPGHHGDSGALGSASGWVDFCGDEPRGDEPADAEDGGGEVEDDDARNSGREQGDVEVGFVGCEAAEDCENAKADCPGFEMIVSINGLGVVGKVNLSYSQNAPLTMSQRRP
jgi:hypothetical protein